MMLPDAGASSLSRWESFYVIVGSSAGALTGLQFVVIALVAEAQAASSMLEIRAFGTPNVVHFSTVLLISAILSAPWSALWSAAVCLVACGLAGLLYGATVIKHARRQKAYSPDAEDWLWYAALPLLAYAALLVGASAVARHPSPALFVIAATALLLLFIGIHNAWDTVTYIAIERRQQPKGRSDQK